MAKEHVLEKRGVIEVLLFLLNTKEVTFTDLAERTKIPRETLHKTTLPTLKEAGLIEEVYEEAFPRRRIIKLSDKGKRVAELLKEIEGILS